MGNTIKLLFLIPAFLAGCALTTLGYRYMHEQMVVDRCLSAQHGSFDYLKMSCDLQQNHVYIPYEARHPHDKRLAVLAFGILTISLSGYGYIVSSREEL